MVPEEEWGIDGLSGWASADAPVELSADERLRLAEREQRARSLHGRLSEEIQIEARERQVRRRRSTVRKVAIVAVAGLLVATITKVAQNEPDAATRGSQVLHGGTDGIGGLAQVDASRPTLTPPTDTEPLGEPPPLPTGSGPYKFAAMRSDRDAPVTYDPCREIRYVVNAEHQPPGGDKLLAEAIRRASEATGLRFVDGGSTDEQPTEGRPAFQPDRYGDRWAPVVIWWATPEKATTLKGRVAGFGGSTAIQSTDPFGTVTATYVTGIVVLDGPQLVETLSAETNGEAGVTSVIQHELGHLVGLDHVNDPTQLMNPEASRSVTDWADGDLRGLNELGRGDCVPSL